MAMNKDIHPELGPKNRYPNMLACLRHVRLVHPSVCMEGSTGPERTFWNNGELVAHAWSIRKSNEFWLRVNKR